MVLKYEMPFQSFSPPNFPIVFNRFFYNGCFLPCNMFWERTKEQKPKYEGYIYLHYSQRLLVHGSNLKTHITTRSSTKRLVVFKNLQTQSIATNLLIKI